MFQPRPISRTQLMLVGLLFAIILFSSIASSSKSSDVDTSISTRQKKLDYLVKVTKLLRNENFALYEGVSKIYQHVSENITKDSQTKIEKNLSSLQKNFEKIGKNLKQLN